MKGPAEPRASLRKKIRPRRLRPTGKLLRRARRSTDEPSSCSNDVDELADFKLPLDDVSMLCPICLDYIVSAVTTACGHSFCEKCIYEYMLYFRKCECCPRKLKSSKELGKSKNIDSIIDSQLSLLHPDEKIRYKARLDEHKRYQELKTIKEFCVGMVLDVRSPEMVWCEGIVKKILYKRDTSKRMIIVKYKNIPTAFNEEISESSERLATHRFFTGNADFPKLTINKLGQRVISVLGRPLDFAFMDANQEDNRKCLAESDSSYECSEKDD